MSSMFAESTPTCGGFSIIAATTPASISTAKTTRLRDAASFGLRPTNPARSYHRFQHIYALFFYALFSLDYVFVRDFECFFLPVPRLSETHQASAARIRHPLCGQSVSTSPTCSFCRSCVLGKSPLLVAGAFLLVHLIIGLTVSLVFQTTHTIDSTYFPSDRSEFDNGVYHIFATTADYATENPLVGWLVGGLNHHIVHHLCPFVCHTHYAPLTRIVKETAEEFGVPYRQHPTMTRAIRHHLLLLKQLGNETCS